MEPIVKWVLGIVGVLLTALVILVQQAIQHSNEAGLKAEHVSGKLTAHECQALEAEDWIKQTLMEIKLDIKEIKEDVKENDNEARRWRTTFDKGRTQ